MAKTKQGREPGKEKVEKHESSVALTLTDGERTLNLGRATITWSTPPSGSHPCSSQLFLAAVLAAKKRYASIFKGLELRYLWRISDASGNQITLSDFDSKLIHAAEVNQPLTIKRLGIDYAFIE